jgi:hypothetical protein
MNRSEYERLKKQAEMDYRKNLEAIERVFRMTNPFGQESLSEQTDDDKVEDKPKAKPEDKEEVETRSDTGWAGKGSVIRGVNEALKQVPTEFKLADILKIMEENGCVAKGPSIRIVLAKMVENDILKIARQGIGRSATIYQKEGS